MTTEEKAKAYDKAIERAKQHCADYVVETIFSELKESEGERIRKDIISFVEQAIDAGYGIISKERKEKWIAWLKKQGEQNLVNTDLDELVIQLEETIGTSPHSRETIKDFFKMAVQKYMNCLKIANGEIGSLVEENYRLKEKQGKQMPAWSEEDEDIRDTIIRDLKHLGGDIVNVKPAYKEEVGWLKSLKERYTWRPSDEQMKALESIFAKHGAYNDDLLSLISDLKKTKRVKL